MKTVARRRFSIQPLRLRGGGFTLVELALVLLVIGLLAFLFLPPSLALLEQGRRNDTRAKLQTLEHALARFVAVNRRLPCPANGAYGTGQPLSGLEQRAPGGGCANAALANGVVPWRSLGVDDALAIDAWSSLVTYRVWTRAASGVQSGVQTGLTQGGGLDMSACDPAGTGPLDAAQGCAPGTPASAPLTFLAIKPDAGPGEPQWRQMRGFGICRNLPCVRTVQAAAPSANELARRVDGNGAAYVLISHGGNRLGAFTVGGSLVAGAMGAREAVNANGQAMRWTAQGQNPDPNIDDTFYIDAEFDENPADTFDDVVRRPSVLEVAYGAGLGPRPR